MLLLLGLPVVVCATQKLEVQFIAEQCLVPAVRHDVVQVQPVLVQHAGSLAATVGGLWCPWEPGAAHRSDVVLDQLQPESLPQPPPPHAVAPLRRCPTPLFDLSRMLSAAPSCHQEGTARRRTGAQERARHGIATASFAGRWPLGRSPAGSRAGRAHRQPRRGFHPCGLRSARAPRGRALHGAPAAQSARYPQQPGHRATPAS